VVKSSGSGAPYFCKKADLKDEGFKIFNSIKEKRYDEEVFNMPNVIYQVVQASKSGKYKRRLVYCPPFAVTILELYFGLNIQKFFVGNKLSSIVIGHKQLHLYDLNLGLGDFYKASGDYSSYDQTLPSFFIKLSFEILKSFYSFNNEYESGLYDRLVSYIMHGHIFHPHCGTINRKRGIASGSVFTNLVDSILNLLVMNYVSHLIGKEYRHIYVCGDDNLLATDTILNVQRISHMIKKIFNMSIEFTEKGIVDKGCSNSLFLGSYWTEDGPERELKRMILSASKLSWNWPNFDERDDFIDGRLYSILGFDHRLPDFWKRLRRKPYEGRRLYEFIEATS
jgi:hypothetical protein